MTEQGTRDDIEALARALCSSATGNDSKWSEWIPKAKELADKVYGQLLESCQLAYRKHVMEDDTIGWESLGEQLCNGLVGTMGEEKYTEWLDSLETVK